MDPDEMLRTADDWMGQGTELARRMAAYAELVRQGGLPKDLMHGTGSAEGIAEDIEAILRQEWNPADAPSRPS